MQSAEKHAAEILPLSIPAAARQIAKKPYQFLLISALREYLTLEFEPPVPLPFPYDPERIVDDFGEPCPPRHSGTPPTCGTDDTAWSGGVG